jgi:hypothetical protein
LRIYKIIRLYLGNILFFFTIQPLEKKKTKFSDRNTIHRFIHTSLIMQPTVLQPSFYTWNEKEKCIIYGIIDEKKFASHTHFMHE